MTQITWDSVGERLYETGVDRGVLYIPNGGVYDTGIGWNGLTKVTEKPSGASPSPLYADNGKYLNLISAEDFSGTIEAFTYPKEFAACDGTGAPAVGIAVGQQSRKSFGFAYRTKVGNDVLAGDYGYKIHLVYGALASPSERAYETVNDSPSALAFSWDFTTTPVNVPNFKPSAILTIDSTKVIAANLLVLENALYGTAGTTPRLPLPTEVIEMFAGSQTIVTTVAPAYASTTGIITIPTVTGVQYRRGDTNANLVGGSTITLAVGQSLTIKAVPQSGAFVFSAASDDDWVYTRA